jgi:multidrug efflux pump
MNLSKFFIDRPIFAGVLSLLMLIAGLLALRGLPISEYPEVVPPSVVVRAQYPGANPKVIAETVATPLEEAINGVEGMLYMGSQATTDGLMTLTVRWAPIPTRPSSWCRTGCRRPNHGCLKKCGASVSPPSSPHPT